METVLLTCPRCFLAVPPGPGARYCPRCGLPDVRAAASDTSPIEVRSGGRAYRALDRIAVGSLCGVYRCRYDSNGAEVEGVIKIARDSCANGWVANEASVLRHLRAPASAEQFAPFLPALEASFDVTGDASPRRATVLRLDDGIRSPDELYTLDDVRRAYPHGIDARDAAWIWRRLLHVLGFAHAHGIVHRAVLPPHVLIEPRGHKLVLIDWCFAATAATGRAVELLTGGYDDWYRRSGAFRTVSRPGLDVATATRCMVEILGGDPVRAECPSTLDPALRRYFGRCLGPDRTGAATGAWKLLDDFDRLIEALWGPRTFRPFTLPPKAAADPNLTRKELHHGKR